MLIFVHRLCSSRCTKKPSKWRKTLIIYKTCWVTNYYQPLKPGKLNRQKRSFPLWLIIGQLLVYKKIWRHKVLIGKCPQRLRCSNSSIHGCSIICTAQITNSLKLFWNRSFPLDPFSKQRWLNYEPRKPYKSLGMSTVKKRWNFCSKHSPRSLSKVIMRTLFQFASGEIGTMWIGY